MKWHPGTRGGKLFTAAGVALAVLLLLGILLGCFHHHSPGQDEDACALCSLVHVVAIAPLRVDPPPTRILESGIVALPPPPSSTSEERYTAPTRAPPLS